MIENTGTTSAHEWVIGAVVRLTREQEQDLLVADILGETPRFALPAGAETEPVILACRRCLRPFDDDADNEPCIPVPMP
ncbi:hypothetical protein ACWDRB_47950 [Nonomuraea sp. NPDC003707]